MQGPRTDRQNQSLNPAAAYAPRGNNRLNETIELNYFSGLGYEQR